MCKKVASFVLLFFSLIYSLQFIFWSIWPDALYYLNILPFWKDNILITGTLAIGNAWCEVFGHTLISLRFFNWIVCIVSLLIAYFGLCRNNSNKKGLLLLAITIFYMGYTNKNMYNPDTFTTCATVLLAIGLIRRFEKKSSEKSFIIFMPIVSGFAIWCRFPSIVLLLLVPFCLFINDIIINKEKSQFVIIEILAYIIGSVFSYYFLLCLVLSKFNGLPDIIQSLTGMEPDPTHTYKHMLLFYWQDLWRTLQEFVWPIIIAFAGFFVALKFKKPLFITVIVAIVLSLWLSSLADHHCCYSWYKYISITIFVIMFVRCIKDSKSDNIVKAFYPLIILFACGVVNIAGSDTGIQNLFPYSIIFLPYIVTYYKEKSSIHPYFALLFILLLPVHLYASLTNNFMFSSIVTQTERLENCYKLSGIAVSMREKKDMNKYIDMLNKYGKLNHTIIYANSHISHSFYSCTGTNVLYNCSFWMLDYWEKEIQNIATMMKANPDYVLFYEYDNYDVLGEGFVVVAEENGLKVIRYEGN